jgi:iron complex outermembrane receptor protein
VRGKLDWAAANNLHFLLSSEYMRRVDRNGNNFQLLDDDPFCAVCSANNVHPAPGFYETNINRDGAFISKYSFTFLKTTLDLDSLTVINTTSYRDQRLDSALADVDLSSADIFNFQTRLRNRTFTDELQISSDLDGPLNFILGAFYLHDKLNYQNNLGGLQFGGLAIRNDSTIITNSASAFGEASFDLTQALKITLGARYNYDKKAIEGINNADAILAFGVPGFKQTVHFNSFTPRAVISYQTDIGNFYASYNKGFKSGGLVTPAFSVIPPVKPEKIWSAEIGAKLNFVDGRVKLNLAAFHYKSTDLQVQTVVFPTGSITTNAGAAKGDGVNVELQLAPAKGFRVGSGLGYLHARYSDYINAPLYELTPGGTGFSIIPIVPGSNAPDLTGFPLESAPKWSGFLSASYETEFESGWKANISSIARYNSSFDFRAGGQSLDRRARQTGYTTINLTGFLATPDDKYKIGFYVRNLTDKKYDLLRQVTNFGTFHAAAQPRTYGINVQYKFGN